MKLGDDIIYGPRAVLEAIEAGKQLDRILVRKGAQGELVHELFHRCREAKLPIQLVPIEKLERTAPGANHQGVVAFASIITWSPLEEVITRTMESGVTPLLIMLDSVSDVRNLGAIARTAECMGAQALIVPEQGAARVNADAVKVSAGALNYLPLCRVANPIDAILLMQQYGLRIIACTEKAPRNLYQADLKQPLCLLFGAEDKGISTSILKRADEQIRIPLQGKIESLNVSVAVGMVLSESARQKQA